MSNIVQLYDASNNKVYPVTHLRSVRDSSGTTLESMMQDVREIAVGYYECSTPGSTAAKTITIDSSVSLSTKILCKVKFVEKNTVNNATMNINGTGAKALYYNGVRAAANNSWYPNEVVDLYYDGTNYQAKSCADTLEYDVSLHQTHEITEITTTTRTLVFNGNVVSGWESETPVSDSSVEGYTRSETNTGQNVDSTTVDGPNATYDSTANKTNVVYVTTHTYTHVVNNYTFSEAVNAVPEAYRHGGLKLRFISNSDDNKYVQYRLMSDNFSFTESDWQGVDDIPTANSDNLVKSGGVYAKIKSLEDAGYVFAGVATPATNPGTPDGHVFYLASESGTYSNFGGITLAEEVAILSNTNGSWVKSDTGIATNTKVSVLGNKINEVNNKKLERYNNNDVSTIVDKSETFFVTDSLGNIIAKIAKDGISTTNLNTPRINDVSTIADKSETFFLTDSLGNIIAKIAKDGISTTNLNTPRINGKNFSFDNIKSFYYGKNIVLFGDSLSYSGKWALKFAEITGAIFDQSINDGTSEINNGYPTSYGGTQSWGFGNSGWQRAMNIVEKVSNTNNVNGIDINVLFIMNVNDAYKVTTGIKKGDEGYGVDSSGYTLSEDGAYVPDFSLFLETPAFFSRTRVIAETVFDTEEGALNDFRNNIIQRWGDVDRSAFCCYTYRHYSSQAKLLTINGNTTSAGTLTIHIGEQAYGIEITQGMTANAVIKAIENYDYDGCNDVIQPDGISILFSKQDNTTIDLTVDVGTTGIGYSITDKNSIREVELFYSLYDTSDGNFTDISNWKYIYQITNIFGLYKGVIEYFQKNLPNTKIVFLSGPVINLPFGDSEKIKEYQNADGSLSLQKIIEKESYMKTHPALRQIQQYVCQKYMIDYVDLANRNGISFFNAYPKYYNNADVHPRNEGYEHWGKWLAYNL